MDWILSNVKTVIIFSILFTLVCFVVLWINYLNELKKDNDSQFKSITISRSIILVSAMFIFIIGKSFANYFEQTIVILYDRIINERFFLNISDQEKRISEEILINLERSVLIVFSLFFPLLFNLYINFRKDVITAIEKISVLHGSNKINDDELFDINKGLKSCDFQYDSVYKTLKGLFWIIGILFLVMLFAIATIEWIGLNNFCYNILKLLKAINFLIIVGLFELLVSYYLIVIPYYKLLFDSKKFKLSS